MPYTDDDKLPEYVQKLPQAKREQWIAVFNSSFENCDEGDCEAIAFRNANGVVGVKTLIANQVLPDRTLVIEYKEHVQKCPECGSEEGDVCEICGTQMQRTLVTQTMARVGSQIKCNHDQCDHGAAHALKVKGVSLSYCKDHLAGAVEVLNKNDLVVDDSETLEPGRWISVKNDVEKTTAIMALRPSDELADRLTLVDSDAETPNELHVTLAYLGDTDMLDQEKVLKTVGGIASNTPPIEARLNGITRFTETHKDGQHAVVLNVDSPEIEGLRQSVMDQLKIEPSDHGFTPHITLSFIPEDAEMPEVELPDEPVTFDALWLFWGDERFRFEFIGKKEQEIENSEDEKANLPDEALSIKDDIAAMVEQADTDEKCSSHTQHEEEQPMENQEEIQTDDKAGRRVRQDKVGLIERIKAEFEDLRQAVVALLSWAKYEDREELVSIEGEKMEDTKQKKYQVQSFHTDFAKAEPGDEWSFSAKDGNAIIEEGGWELFKKIHLVADVSDGTTPENKAAYTYPVAKLVDGKPVYFFKAAATVNSGLSGGARSADLPKATNEKAAGTVRKIYEMFERDPETVTVKQISLDEWTNVIRRAFDVQFPGRDRTELPSDMWVIEVFMDHVIIEHGGEMYHVPYIGRDDAIVFALLNEWVEVEKRVTYVEKSLRVKTLDLTEVDTLAFAFKSADGSDWWLQFTTNAFEDREAEIFTTKALEEYVKRHRNDEIKGQFWYRHIPGTKFADVRWQAMVGRFLVQAGPFDDTPIGHAFKNFFTKYPRDHPKIAPRGWGTSHGYHYDLADRLDDGIYNWLEIRESTVLPSHVASNPWSPLPVIVQRSKEMDDQERKELEEIGGQDLVSLVTGQAENATNELEKAVEFKAADGMTEAKAAIGALTDAKIKTALMKALDVLVDEDEKKTEDTKKEIKPITRDEIAEAMKAIVTQMRGEIVESSKGVATAVENSITEAMKPLIESVKQIRKADDEKIAEQAELTPAASLREMVESAVKADATKVAETDPLVARKPNEAQPINAGQGFPPFIQKLVSKG